jgi:uncharacterized protein
MGFIIAAITLGFLGGFHCIGMCGPIALALPIHQLSKTKKALSVVLYNSGRIITYSGMGLFFGLIGQSFNFFGFQQKLSVVLGAAILFSLLFATVLRKRKFFQNNPLNKMFSVLRGKLSTLFHEKRSSFFLIGLLNGFLPCGLVYMGIAGAVATGSAFKGAIFMAFFGAGTFPFMVLISYTSHLISLRSRKFIQKSVPVVVGIMAILLILRGANFGIAYLSPKIIETSASKTCTKQLNCCHKK